MLTDRHGRLPAGEVGDALLERVPDAPFGLALDDKLPIRIDLYSQLHWLVSRTHVKDANVKPDSIGAPQVTSGGSIWVWGMTTGVRF